MPRVQGEIIFDHVEFSYDSERSGNRPVLHDINLRIEPGNFGCTGRADGQRQNNDRYLCRFYDVIGGRITVDGYDVREVTQRSLRSQIGVVLQEPFIFTDTIANNIRYGRPDATMDEIIAAAKLANCHDFISKLTDDMRRWRRSVGHNLALASANCSLSLVRSSPTHVSSCLTRRPPPLTRRQKR
ncbi:MAG: hypothetical protein R2867_44870 [Caldilineaceae bacterium]